jgi:Na+/H+ antiporter NhaD/arsenite permease-like protein
VIAGFIKKQTILFISLVITLITVVIVPPTPAYIGYIDFYVLVLLFCLMAVVAGFRRTGLFDHLSRRFVSHAGNERMLYLFLVILCFFSSMLITNDVALIAFIPFSIVVLNTAGSQKNIINVLVLETIAANLGSMLTPIGNPQNLYIYSFYKLSSADIFSTLLPYSALSLILLILSVYLLKTDKRILAKTFTDIMIDKKSLLLYMVLFTLCILTVLKVIPYLVLLPVILAVVSISDRNVLKKVDYSLLLIFVCFFITVGNLGRIDVIRAFLEHVTKGHELASSLLLSQVISNVPAAVLLSNYTGDYRSLLIGTDVGGLGTVIASLASLITFKIYLATEYARPSRYMLIFTIYNISFLIVLLLIT